MIISRIYWMVVVYLANILLHICFHARALAETTNYHNENTPKDLVNLAKTSFKSRSRNAKQQSIHSSIKIGQPQSTTHHNPDSHKQRSKMKRSGPGAATSHFHSNHTEVKRGIHIPGLYVLSVPRKIDATYIDSSWFSIPMPKKSYFSGFNPPRNPQRWKVAQLQASRGEQILLSRMLQKIRSPLDIIRNDKQFKWIHNIAEYHQSKDGFLKSNADEEVRAQNRAPLTLFGYHVFSGPGFEGNHVQFKDFGPNEFINNIRNKNGKIPFKMVGIGMMDENWGWLSTYFLNRTVMWGKVFSGVDNPYDSKFTYPIDQIKFLLDDPNMVMLVVNQHHNCSHPKVISMPLGVSLDPQVFWRNIYKIAANGTQKRHLLFSAGSDYAFRPSIRSCIANNMKNDFEIFPKMTSDEYNRKIVESYFVLSLPGVGYDCYRLWETLYSGSIPVLERGFGFDRTLYKLPALLVDDFADITADMLRQAYLEILYRADDWEYDRLTKQYWERLLYAVADSSSLAPLLRKHPMHAEDQNFTRPLVPFDCDAMGGCGAGTKRTPKVSCAVESKVMNRDYLWKWDT